MVVSIGAVASASQSVFYYEKDGYYARDDPAHREASSWAGKGAADLGLEGPVDPEVFRSVLEGEVPNGSGHRLRWPTPGSERACRVPGAPIAGMERQAMPSLWRPCRVGLVLIR